MHTDPSPFGDLGPADRAILDAVMEPVAYAPESILFDEGDPGDAAYLIESGEVRIEVDLKEIDSEGVLTYLGAGSLLGEIALLDGRPRSARAVANGPVTARRIRRASLDALAATHPSVVLAVVRALGRDAATRLRDTTAKLADQLFAAMPDPEVDEMTAAAVAAQAAFAPWEEARVDALLLALAQAVAAQAQALAEATVSETHVGNVVDKAFKNQVASLGVAQGLVGRAGAGVVGEGEALVELAAPVGVVFGLVPLTNPVATAIFKVLIALKARNAIILSFHHAALGTAARLGEVLDPVLAAHGAPPGLVQWVKKRASRRKTGAFMRHPDVGLILATGGAGMVKAAYSSGTPALGVGPGNAPALVTADADLDHAARSIVASKSFDNGLICGAEHNLVVEQAAVAELSRQLERYGAAVLGPEEAEGFAAAAVDAAKDRFRPQIVGQSAALIAKVAGIRRPWPIRLVVVPRPWTGESTPWSREKMAPMLSLFTVASAEEGLAVARALLTFDGTGHTAIVHTGSDAFARRYAEALPASRVLVNSPGSHGVVGFCTALTPSFTLGCGTFGGNSTTDNVSFTHLRNLKRVARFIDPAARGLELPPGYPVPVT